jgi:hypothetical protein
MYKCLSTSAGRSGGTFSFEERVTPLVPGVSPTKFDGGAPNFDGRSGVRPFHHFAVWYEVLLVTPISLISSERQALSRCPARILPHSATNPTPKQHPTEIVVLAVVSRVASQDLTRVFCIVPTATRQ